MHSEDLSRGCSRIAASYVIHTALTEPSHGHTNSLVDSARVRLVDCGVWTCGVTNQKISAPQWPWETTWCTSPVSAASQGQRRSGTPQRRTRKHTCTTIKDHSSTARNVVRFA